jgi:hypothetical protein
MQSKYGKLSAVELRELCLKDELNVAQVSLEELEKLFGYESELDDPQAEVLIFCSKGFDRFDKYRKDIRKPSLKKIYRENNVDERRRATKPALRVLKMAATIAIIITLTAFTAQAVSLALGYNLFEFVRDWLFNDEVVEVLTSEPNEDGVLDLRDIRTTTAATEDDSSYEPPEDEFVFLDFERLEDIDDVWLSRVSRVLVEGYEFVYADYTLFQGDTIFKIYFMNENEDFVALDIQDIPMLYVERENYGDIEIVIIDNITFEIFNNIEDFHVIWEHYGWFYKLNAFLPRDEVMGIIAGWY